MHKCPLAALPPLEHSNRHIYHQAVDAPLGDVQGQVPFLTQSSNTHLRTMSEPVPLLHCALDPVGSHVKKWKELQMDNSSPCDESDVKQNGHCGGRQSSDTSPGTGQDKELSDLCCSAAASQMEAQKLTQQQVGSPTETWTLPAVDNCNCVNHLSMPVNATEDFSMDGPRIVKHKPSAIVFCDNVCSNDHLLVTVSQTSDGREFSSSTSEVGEDDDDFPETLQYKEFLVSRRRRNLSRNRKCLRRRQDAHPGSTASDWQKSSSKGKCEFTGSQEEEETEKNNEKQVRKTSY